MNEQDDKRKPEAGACGPGCACNAPGPAGKARWFVGVIVLIAAGVLVARALVKNHGGSAAPASTGFAALPAPELPAAPDATATPTDTNAVREIAALSELNAVAADAVGVFVFLPGNSETTAQAPMAQLLGAARTMEPQLNGGKIGIFTLKVGSPDYTQFSAQMAVPGVLAMVKGAGMSAASGDITETRLVQTFVAASSAGGCGPASGGCGPGGCN